MTNCSASPESVLKAIEKLRMRLGPIFRDLNHKRLVEAWNDRWRTDLLKIEKENAGRPEVAIALIGGTGSGKSTLLNALLDARLLPVSNMRACTAAISEVSFQEGPVYAAEVTFISRDSWQSEINNLLQDIADRDIAADGDSDDGRSAAADVSKAAADKIRVVYKVDASEPLESFHLSKLREPPEIRDALNRGSVRFESGDFEEFRKQLRVYLDSKHAYWPIVETVRVRGPFDALSGGVKVVDLPGINDPNEAREQVTRTYLKTSRFVWVVFNIKRILTADIKALIQSDDFVRQIVMDGRESAMTFVGTASDDLDLDSAREEFELDEDCDDAEVVAARNSAARKAVEAQLRDFARDLAERANDPTRSEHLAAAFGQCRHFTTSAKDYLVLTGHSKSKKRTLDSVEQTQIVALRDHMQRISEDYGIEAQSRTLHQRVRLIIDEMLETCAKEKASLDQSAVFTVKRRKEMGEAIDRLATFLGQKLEDHHERFVQDLSASRELLSERLKRAIERGSQELNYIVSGWRRIHWCTLKAISRRSGRFTSPTSGQYDLPREIAKPILDGITFAWTDFFGDRMKQRLEKWTDRLNSLAHKHGVDLLKDLARVVPESQEQLHRDFESMVDQTDKVTIELLGQAQSQMLAKLDEVRRDLYDEIPYQIGADMKKAFLDAAEEKGTGMKMRMIDLLSKHATTVSADMFTRTEERISEGVRELVDQLDRRFKEMTATVQRHAELPVDNLVNAEKIPEDEIRVMQQSVASLAKAASELRKDGVILGEVVSREPKVAHV